MYQNLHIDIETRCSVDLAKSGAHKYTDSFDFEIILVAYAFDDSPIKIVDLEQGEKLPIKFVEALTDSDVSKWAHNAIFEMLSFKAYGYKIIPEQWYCSMVKSAYCGLPLSLRGVSEALKLGSKGKDLKGKALINYFCSPCKPTKRNDGRTQNYAYHDLLKWETFKEYCKQDVEAERKICNILAPYHLPHWERLVYLLDQKINNIGVKIDVEFVQSAIKIAGEYNKGINEDIKNITGIENPGSVAQLKSWLNGAININVESLAKDKIEELIKGTGSDTAIKVLKLRQKSSKTSNKKYPAMLNCLCEDGRIKGLFQYYGANRTGRWAGRLVQLQNLPQNHLESLKETREIVKQGDIGFLNLLYDNTSKVLSELIRTAFIPSYNHIFAVADYSAIEARVVAWLAGEKWRMEVFRTHGKIYEASAAMMFGVDINEVTKGSTYRKKGKISELALGYNGAVGAMKKMGGEAMGLSVPEMESIVEQWRRKNKAITSLWKSLEDSAKKALRSKGKEIRDTHQNLIFKYDGVFLTIQLPSGRKLFYNSPSFTTNRFGNESIRYKGMDQTTKKWGYVETYGGKLTENIVQAISRDLLAEAMLRLDNKGHTIVMHVHDEIVSEVDKNQAGNKLKEMCDVMSIQPNWARDLPLKADGYLTPFYKKD